MPPKKNKNVKSKSKRYSCNLCAGIDNSLMIQCNDCESKYHLKCLDIDVLDEDDEWICFECLQKDLSRPPKSNNNDKSARSLSKQTNDSGPKGSQIDAEHQSRDHGSRKSDANDDRNTENQSQIRNSHHSVNTSQATRSSVRRRAQLELERLEEETKLKEKRDKEYLDNKYRILLENRSDRTELTESERHSTDRSSFTREWVRKQSVEVQPPSTSRTSSIPPTYGELKTGFNRRIDETKFENTSPLDYQRQLSFMARHLKEKTEPNATLMSKERQYTQSSSMYTRGASNRERIPCPAHDAKKFMFQGPMKSNPDVNVGIPCSNSTFAIPPTYNYHMTGDRGTAQRLGAISPESTNYYTLEWDNYLGTQRDMGKHPKLQSDQFSLPSNGKDDIAGTKRDSGRDPELQSDAQMMSIESILAKLDQKKSDKGVFPKNDFEQFMSNRRSTNNQSQRKVEFKESENGDWSNIVNVESQPKINNASSFRANGDLTASQIAARHVVDKKLPNFAGDPNEWPIWHRQYANSTELCGFSNGENLDRLGKCLRGKARDAVRGRLIHSDSVPWVIETLEMLYGRPEVIIKSIINKARNLPPIKPDKLDELMDFAFEVQTICSTIESLNRTNHLTDPMLIEELVDKLPTEEKKDWARHKAGKLNVTLKTLSVWLYDMAKLLSTVATPRVTKSNDRKSEKEKSEINRKAIGLEHVNVHINRMSSGVDNPQGKQRYEKNHQKKFPCPVCNNECNRVEHCSKFKSFDVNARWVECIK